MTTEQNPEPVRSPQTSADGINALHMENAIVEALRSVFDPEIPVNIYDMGLIYDLKIAPDSSVEVIMTLTSPACPVAGTLPPEVEQKVRAVPGVTSARVDVVWDPPWDMEMMSEEAKLELGFF